MLGTKLHQTTQSDAILLVHPRKLEPELALRDSSGGMAAREKQPQRKATFSGQLAQHGLQTTELVPRAARQESSRKV